MVHAWYVIVFLPNENKKVISKYHLVILLLIPFLLQIYFSPLEYGDQTWYSVFCVASFLVGILYIFANIGGVF